MPIMIKFGDIFRFNEQEFVFLAQTHEITYAAKVLNLDDTKSVLRLYEIRNAGNSEKINNVLYSFVILNTPEFKNRMAHLNNTDQNGHHDGYEVINTLNSKDLKEIKEEIINKSSAVPLKLKELMKDIFVE